MEELVLNRFKIEIIDIPSKLYFYTGKELNDENYYLARYKPTRILEWEFLDDEIRSWLVHFKKNITEDEEYIYVSFLENNNKQKELNIRFENLPFPLQKKFIKEIIITELRNRDYIIEPYREGADLSVYKKSINDNQYIRFDLVFNIYKKENKISYGTTIGIGSAETYILKLSENVIQKINGFNSIKYVKNNFLIKREYVTNINGIDFNYPIKTNAEIRKALNLATAPKRRFYKEYYNLIKNFVDEISILLKDKLKLHRYFEKIMHVSRVAFEKNKMVFDKGKVDYSTINGMRDYGPYRIPDNAKNTKLLFIYPDKESANTLYTYLSRGYKHFPGLESYVGIPAKIYEKKINYNKDDLSSVIHQIQKELPENNYSDVIAVCIMPFSKSNATNEQSKIYFQIKKILLEKNIPSQFIYRDKIFDENFHFSLPNIAIAMLAKCGGIPWKLAKPHYNQLTIGFNVFQVRDKNNEEIKTYLGSAVFFDNEGIIREVRGYTENNIKTICNSLIESINAYKNEKNEIVNKIVIHFFKTVSRDELIEIEKSIKNNLGDTSIFTIVEINDSKTTIDLCFDLDYELYMPQSGTYIQLKPNEYLLFNNLRYWENPLNPINQEELPVKLRIYDPNNSFDHNELISQVYEFSRMYWKSLKQKAQPVTTVYSKLIADFMAAFDGNLPDTKVSKERVWFI